MNTLFFENLCKVNILDYGVVARKTLAGCKLDQINF